jgi:hypothetical protein
LKYKIIILLLFLNSLVYSSIFDNVNWQYHGARKNIKLFKTCDRLYKVETILNHNNIEDIVSYLTTRETYLKIFPKTKEYKKIKQLNKNKFIIYEIINFSPLKSRDCFFELEINNYKNEYIIEWGPTKKKIKHKNFKNSDYIRVNDIYGRWKIKKIDNKSIYISIEFYSDFKIEIPTALLLSIEREESFKILKNLENFLNKEKKFCYKK